MTHLMYTSYFDWSADFIICFWLLKHWTSFYAFDDCYWFLVGVLWLGWDTEFMWLELDFEIIICCWYGWEPAFWVCNYSHLSAAPRLLAVWCCLPIDRQSVMVRPIDWLSFLSWLDDCPYLWIISLYALSGLCCIFRIGDAFTRL